MEESLDRGRGEVTKKRLRQWARARASRGSGRGGQHVVDFLAHLSEKETKSTICIHSAVLSAIVVALSIDSVVEVVEAARFNHLR